MKKLLFAVMSLAIFVGCKDKKEPLWEFQNNLDLAEVHLNRIIELNDDEKFLGIFEKSGERKDLLSTGDYIITAYIDLGDVKVETNHDKRMYIIKCPNPKIERRNNHIGFDKETVRWSKIDRKEGRKDFTENERQKARNEAIKGLDKEIRDNENHSVIVQLKEDAKVNARQNLPLLLRKLDIDRGYRVRVEFDKEEKGNEKD